MDILRSFSKRRTKQTEPADRRQVRQLRGRLRLHPGRRGPAAPLPGARRGRRHLLRGAARPGGGQRRRSSRGSPSPTRGCWSTPSSRSPPAASRRSSSRRCSPWRTPRRCRESAALALAALPQVARTGTHLFLFAEYVEQFRGWGRGLRRAVASWYVDKGRGRGRLPGGQVPPARGLVAPRPAAPGAPGDRRAGAARHLRLDRAGLRLGEHDARALVEGVRAGAGGHRCRRRGRGWCASTGCPGRCSPTPRSARPTVWDALLDEGVPQTALMRQLPRLTRLGLLPDLGGRTDEVVAQLHRRGPAPQGAGAPGRRAGGAAHLRLGPLGCAARASGRPSRKVVDALDAAFYRAFGAVQPSGTPHAAGAGRVRLDGRADLRAAAHRPRGLGRAGAGARWPPSRPRPRRLLAPSTAAAGTTRR